MKQKVSIAKAQKHNGRPAEVKRVLIPPRTSWFVRSMRPFVCGTPGCDDSHGIPMDLAAARMVFEESLYKTLMLSSGRMNWCRATIVSCVSYVGQGAAYRKLV